MRSARIATRLLALTLAAAVAGLLGAGPAGAGEYPIRQCAGSDNDGFSGEYFQMNTLDRVHVVSGCVPGGADKIGIYQDRSGLRFQNSGGGQFIWGPVPGLQIVGTTLTAKLRDANGIKARVSGPSAQWGDFDLYEGQPHDGQVRTTRWSGETQRPDLVTVRLRCERLDGCANEPDGPKAFVELFDLEIRSSGRSRTANHAVGKPVAGRRVRRLEPRQRKSRGLLPRRRQRYRAGLGRGQRFRGRSRQRRLPG